MDKILVKDVVACLLKMPQDMEVLEPLEEFGLVIKTDLPHTGFFKEEQKWGETNFKEYSSGDDKSTFKKYCVI